MSFVYAIKHTIEYHGDVYKCTDIYSDTKVSLEGTSRANWGDRTRNQIEKYGLIKTIILSPKCCISFAGNNISHAHDLLCKLYEIQQFSKDELLNLALVIHRKAPNNEIEFIICLADETDEIEIICIKNGEMHRNCTVAWIGSYDAFSYLQKYRLENPALFDNSCTAFMYAVQHCGDDSVGGFCANVGFSNSSKGFLYKERMESVTERAKKLVSGMQIPIGGSAEEGAYTAYYHESNEDVAIEIEQANITLLYTKKYRLHEEDVLNPNTKHFLLPIVVETDTGKVIE